MPTPVRAVGLPGWAAANYRVLRAALGPGELTEEQDRYLIWLAQWDKPTVEAMVSLFRFSRDAASV